MENYQKSTLMMTSLFDQETQEYLFPAVKKVNEKVADGYAVDSPEVKRRFRIFLLMIRHWFITTKKVPVNHYGGNFLHADDETLLVEAKELFRELRGENNGT